MMRVSNRGRLGGIRRVADQGAIPNVATGGEDSIFTLPCPTRSYNRQLISPGLARTGRAAPGQGPVGVGDLGRFSVAVYHRESPRAPLDLLSGGTDLAPIDTRVTLTVDIQVPAPWTRVSSIPEC